MTANILSRKSEADRWDMACELMRFMRQMMADGVGDVHPDWSPEQIDREYIERWVREFNVMDVWQLATDRAKSG